MPRIPLLPPEEMTPEQVEVFRNSPSGKLNIFRLLAHAATLHDGLGRFTQAIFTSLTIPPPEREIAVLAVCSLERGGYPWAQHVQIARAMGIADDKIDAIAAHRFDAAAFDRRERALLAFTRQVVEAARVDDAIFAALADYYDPRQIVETVLTIGTYMMLLRLTEVAELELDAVAGADVVKAAEERAARAGALGAANSAE